MSTNRQQRQDQTWMLSYAKGDAAAFDLLYAQHKVAVYRFFLRQNVTTAIAEELSHDTWLKLIKNRKNYQASALFTTFLFTIARRIAIDHTQKKSTLQEKQQAEEHLNNINDQGKNKNQQVESSIHNEQVLNTENQNLAVAIKQQIANLPYQQREVFLLKQEAGFSIDQIAKITCQNKEKVKSSWRYALKKLRKGLSFYDN